MLGNLQIDGKIVNSFDTPGPTAENGPAPAEFDPNTGTITVYKDFFDTSANSQVEPGRNLFVPPLSTEDFQVLILLHELDHVFGKRHENTGDSPRGSTTRWPRRASTRRSRRTRRHRPVVACGRRRRHRRPSYTVPEYVFVDPLPDGEGDVTIGEITDWDVASASPNRSTTSTWMTAIDPLGCAYDGWGGGHDGYEPTRWLRRLRPVRRRLLLRRTVRPLRCYAGNVCPVHGEPGTSPQGRSPKHSTSECEGEDAASGALAVVAGRQCCLLGH